MSLFTKTLICLTCMCLVVAVSVFSCREAPLQADASDYVTAAQCILIDPGHGGFDGGAVAPDGTIEKDINLHISLKLAEMLKFAGYEVIMTRETDTGTDKTDSSVISDRKKSDLKERLNLINEHKNAIFVSIHLNKFTTSSANGAQVFYSPNHEDSALLGQSIQSSIVQLMQADNTRTIKKGNKSTYLLYHAEIPSVIVECGFLSNPKELDLLKNETYQSQMAFAVFCGIQEYFNNREK